MRSFWEYIIFAIFFKIRVDYFISVLFEFIYLLVYFRFSKYGSTWLREISSCKFCERIVVVLPFSLSFSKFLVAFVASLLYSIPISIRLVFSFWIVCVKLSKVLSIFFSGVSIYSVFIRFYNLNITQIFILFFSSYSTDIIKKFVYIHVVQ